jgi:hypothetical protein
MKYLLICPAALAISGCGAGAPPGSLLHTDSAGVEIVHHSALDSTAPDLWALDDQPVFSIGSAEGNDALHRVTAAALLSDGSIAILNAGTGETRTYTRDGQLLRSFGRTGSGPGEFRAFSRAIDVLPGDTIVVFDPRLRRATMISPSGEAATTTFATTSRAVAGRYIGRLPDGTHLVAHTLARGALSDGRVFQDSVQVIQHGADGAVMAELARLASTEMISVSRPGGAVQIMEMPFGARVWIERAENGIIVAHNRALELRVYSFSGTLQRIVRRDDPVIPLSDEHRKDYPESAFPGMTLPDALPAFDIVVIGSANLVWLARVPPSPREEMITWDALDSSGSIVKRLHVPQEFTVHQITDAELVASGRDDMGVEYVHVFALERT